MLVFRTIILVFLAVFSIALTGPVRSAVSAEESLSDLAFPPVLARKTNPKSWGRDPFESTLRPNIPESRDTEEERETARIGSLALTAIISRHGEGAAIINHEIVRKGDQIGGMKIVEIGKDRVILQDASGPVELKLGPFTVGVSGKSEEPE